MDWPPLSRPMAPRQCIIDLPFQDDSDGEFLFHSITHTDEEQALDDIDIFGLFTNFDPPSPAAAPPSTAFTFDMEQKCFEFDTLVNLKTRPTSTSAKLQRMRTSSYPPFMRPSLRKSGGASGSYRDYINIIRPHHHPPYRHHHQCGLGTQRIQSVPATQAGTSHQIVYSAPHSSTSARWSR